MPEKYRSESWARLGVNTENDFEAVYIVKDASSKKAVAALKKELKDADELYLATDEDREGEAISWHLVELLKPKVPMRRMVFHEITKPAIQNALSNTRDIDMDLVEAQEARRILDRLVGYPLSLLVGKKIKYGLSAGRVQSVSVRLLVERERERRAFRTGSYWDLMADLNKDGEGFQADLRSIDGTRLATGKDFDKETGKIAEGKDVLLLGEEEAKKLLDSLKDRPWQVESVKKSQYTTSPKAPFITSTLQQEASRKLGMSAKQAMSIAQRLYEAGRITYMRTDSTNLSTQALSAARKAATELYGPEYVHDSPRNYASKSKGAQEAHEAIRPAGESFVEPQKTGLSGQEFRLYDLIYKRTIASQMADAKKTRTTVDLKVEVDGKEVIFRATGLRTDFAGFISAYLESTDDPEAELAEREKHLPKLKEGDSVDCTNVEANGHETQPPARYTEASLVKALEEAGIGRPSTYSSIMGKITRDERFARKKGKALVPTYTAFAVIELLEKHFADLVDLDFTASMEDDLDAIARGARSKVDYLHSFYRAEGAFNDQVQHGEEGIDVGEARIVHLSDLPATLRVGKNGPYAEWEADGETRKTDVPEDIPPADLRMEDLEALFAERAQWPKELGVDPETGKTVMVNTGRYGHYLQLGEVEIIEPEEPKEDANGKKKKKKKPKKIKPKTASVPKHISPEEITLDQALAVLRLPRVVGEHPEDGEPVEATIGRYGPYLRHRKNSRSLESPEQVFNISLKEAVEILNKPKARRSGQKVLKELGEDPETGDVINVLDGRYGPYVKQGKTNASLPKGVNPDDMTLERALELLAERRAKTGAKKSKRKSSKKKSTKKKSTKKKSSKKKKSAK
jgi:DNA topoisomerase-1